MLAWLIWLFWFTCLLNFGVKRKEIIFCSSFLVFNNRHRPMMALKELTLSMKQLDTYIIKLNEDL